MDIDTAVKNTLRALTLSEKTLAQGLLYSQQFHKQSRTAWVRAPSFTLKQALETARKGNQKDPFKVKFIRIFCDTLYIDRNDRISPETDERGPIAFTIEFYARRIVAPEASGQTASLMVDMIPDCEIMFCTSKLPSTFGVHLFLGGGTKRPISPVISDSNFGISLRYDESAGDVVAEQFGPPDSAMENINYLNLIDERGNVKEKGIMNDDLPRLLQMQMLVAQANSDTDRQMSIDLLNYVIAATATPWSVYLNYQACSLRSSLSINTDIMAASSVNIYASKQVLKARLAAAMVFENAFRSFYAEEGSAKAQTISALNLLAKSDDALETYKFMLGIRQREYDNAVMANKKASATFNANEKEIDQRSKDFQAGIEKFKRAQEIAAAKSIIKGIIGVGIAIAATVATAGAAAPAAVGAVAGAASTAAKAASLIAKLKKIFDDLKKIYEKIKPVIEKIREVIETATAVVESLRKFNEVTGSATALKPNTTSTDVFNATAEWRRFGEAVRDMQESLGGYEIEGKDKFFFALRTLVINGECYILTQANLITKSDELATTIIQNKMEGRDHDRLSAMTYNFSNDAKVLELLKRAMFDRLLAIRSLVYLDFFTYCSAYGYHTLLREKVITLSPVKPVVDYLEDAAKLQGAVVAFGSRALVQTRKFRWPTLGGYDNAEALASQLTQNGSVRVTVDPQNTMWKGFTRIRLSGVRCYLEGVRASSMSEHSTGNIQVQLTTDGRFFDRDSTLVESGQKQIAIRSFLGDVRTVLFEYNMDSRSVVCDGQYGQERDYTKHTPITTWEIHVVGAGLPTQPSGSAAVDEPATADAEVPLPNTPFDFSAVTGLTMEFECDVIWVGS